MSDGGIDRATFRRLSEANPGGREKRALPISEFEFRTGANSSLHLEGYASVFDTPYEVNGGSRGNGFDEVVTRSAFTRTISENPDVHLLINHEGTPLARTKSGTMRLSTDSRGLVVDADLDLRDPAAAGLAIKMERKDMDEMSFAFRVRKQSWSDDDTTRSLEEVDIHKGDVSVVNWGANPNTSATATLRAAVEMLGDLREEQLAELRAMSHEVDAAVKALMSARADAPYGDVDYADPGYLDADDKQAHDGGGVKRYPVDTEEHAKAAWSYINQAKNAELYTSTQLADIKSKIRGALKKFGVDVSEDSEKKSLRAVVAELLTREMDDFESGDVFDSGEPHDSMLAQAVHDLVAGSDGVWCNAGNVFEEPSSVPQNNSAISTAELRRQLAGTAASVAELRAALEAEAA